MKKNIGLKLFSFTSMLILVLQGSLLIMTGRCDIPIAIIYCGVCNEFGLVASIFAICTYNFLNNSKTVYQFVRNTTILCPNEAVRNEHLYRNCLFHSAIYASIHHKTKIFLAPLEQFALIKMRSLMSNDDKSCWNGIDVFYLKRLKTSTQKTDHFLFSL